MQIFELTQKLNLKEYDPDRSPTKPNYGTGVGPGVTPQMTATPRMKTAPQPGSVPQLPAPATGAVTPVASAPELQVLDAPKQLAGPTSTAAKQIGTNYDPNVVDVVAKPKSPQQALAAPAPTTAPSPANVTTPPAAPTVPTAQTPADIRKTKQAAAAKIAQDQMAPFSKLPAPAVTPADTGIDPELAAAGKVGLTAAPPRKANIGGAIANAMMKHNANQTGLGFMLPKDPDNEVYVDRTGKITVGGEPYDARNPEHQQAAGKIVIGGQPYNGANPEHRAAYLAFKNTASQGGADTVKIDADGKITVLGQPFNPANPGHMQAYRKFMLGSSVKTTPPQATPAAAQQPPAAAQGSPAVAQALEKLGFTAPQAAAMAAKVPPGTSEQDAIKLGLAGKLNESLIWSRKFDPSATLLKKIKSQL
jgi:hypothetical protein